MFVALCNFYVGFEFLTAAVPRFFVGQFLLHWFPLFSLAAIQSNFGNLVTEEPVLVPNHSFFKIHPHPSYPPLIEWDTASDYRNTQVDTLTAPTAPTQVK